jgi:hypothetical protein
MLWRQTKTHEWLGERKDSRVAGTHDWLGDGLFLRERTKTSRNVTISFSQSPERATATRGRVQLVIQINSHYSWLLGRSISEQLTSNGNNDLYLGDAQFESRLQHWIPWLTRFSSVPLRQHFSMPGRGPLMDPRPIIGPQSHKGWEPPL